jgi:hypothetical protein
MALGGPCFSRFLLNVIFAHACRHMPEDDPRFAPFERGETFLRDAMLLLIEEMQQSKPRIPTIQGLLILGGRQCAVGKSSEGWLYTGMVSILFQPSSCVELLLTTSGNPNDDRSWLTHTQKQGFTDEGI